MVVGRASGEIVTVPGFEPGLFRRRVRSLSRRMNFDRFDMARIVAHALHAAVVNRAVITPKPTAFWAELVEVPGMSLSKSLD
jgi:hypothetical protein